MRLNSVARTLALPSGIPVVNHFRYLGIDISPFIFHIASHNCQSQFNRIDKDLQLWSKLPNALQACVSVIKMDVLPRVNFYSTMIPLALPRG